MILKTKYKDQKGRKYEVGADVSHLPEEEKKFLRKAGHLDETPPKKEVVDVKKPVEGDDE
jgi:hypothetical protein